METLKYSQIFKEDLSLGTGTREITLADGRVVTLNQIQVTQLPSSLTPGLVLYAGSDGAPTGESGFSYDASTDILTAPGATVSKRLMLTQGSSITAASSITIPADGNFFSVTGNTGITAIAASSLQAGTIFFLKFSGTPTITHNSTTLIMQDGLDLTIAAGTILGFISLGSGNVQEIFRAGQAVTPALPRGYIDGLEISKSAATTLGIAAGVCRDGSNAQNLSLASAYTKTSSAWAVGTGSGGLLSGTFAVSTRFFVYTLFRSDTKVTDVGFEASATPTLPTNYTHSRLIGHFTTDGSGNIDQIYQLDDELQSVCEFRLTLTSNTPVTTGDVTAATTLYCTPYKGNRIALYDGSGIWNVRKSAQFSIAVPATTSTMYDVFVYDNSGVPTLELTAWTNDTTRATALALQNGVYVKSGTTTRRYLGSFRTTGSSGQTEDSLAKRYVWNYYNRVLRPMKVVEATNSWTYSTAGFRQANGSTANQLDYVQGVSEDAVEAIVAGLVASDALSSSIAVGIGVDSTTTQGATVISSGSIHVTSQIIHVWAHYYGFPGVGRHTLVWLETGSGAGTQTWYGDNNAPTLQQAGIIGKLWG